MFSTIRKIEPFLKHRLTRSMSRLKDLKKTSTFSHFMNPDSVIPSTDFAKQNVQVTHTPRILKDGDFSWTLPEERKEYTYLTTSPNALRDLGLDPQESSNQEFQKIVSGQIISPNQPFPYSQAYAGWQFGQFAGQLGDGRVVNLFEVANQQTGKRYELQIKGAGKTPYSRFADGKAVLRSSIREFIISEALQSIGIPTSRALAITYLPKTLAQRYRAETCAMVTRFAESWIRIGNFDLYRWRGDSQGARRLSDYVIKETFQNNIGDFEHIQKANQETLGELTKYDKMFLEIVKRNARTTAMWQVYGFINGVLNTDNTSVLGLSIDFGPFAIMDKFDPDYTSNTEDHQNRYGYKNTPTAIWWNLTRLGENLAELIGAGSKLINDEFFIEKGIKKEWESDIITRASKLIEVAGEDYKTEFMNKYIETMGKRLGLSKTEESDHDFLFAPMLDMLRKTEIDYNKFFVLLQESNFDKATDDETYPVAVANSILPNKDYTNSRYTKKELIEEIAQWLSLYRARLSDSETTDSQRYKLASSANPVFLPRNWILDDVIQYTEDNNGDVKYLNKLLQMSSNPFDKSKWGDDSKELEVKWLSEVGDELSMLQCSCSS